MPDPKEIIVWVIAAPVTIAIVAMLLAHLTSKRRDRATQPWGPALAVAGAFAATYIGLRGWPSMPPRDAQMWLVYLGGVSFLLAVLSAVTARKVWRIALLVLSVALIVATVWLTWRSQIPLFGWPRFLIRMAVVAVCMVAWWLLIDRLSARVPGPVVPMVLMATASVAALALVNIGSVFLGQLAGTVAAAMGAIMVAAFFLKRLTLTHGGALALTVTLIGILLLGRVYDLPWLDLILLTIAPLMAWVGELPVIKGKKRRFIVRLVAVLIVLAIPLVPAAKGLRETMQEQTDSYMY